MSKEAYHSGKRDLLKPTKDHGARVTNTCLFCPRTRVCFADEQNKGPTNRNKGESKSAQSYLSNYQRGQNIYEVKFFSVFYTELSNSSDSNLQMTPLAKKKSRKNKKNLVFQGRNVWEKLGRAPLHFASACVLRARERERERAREERERERGRERERKRRKRKREREESGKGVCVCVCMLSV